jgi:hypothetical protein
LGRRGSGHAAPDEILDDLGNLRAAEAGFAQKRSEVGQPAVALAVARFPEEEPAAEGVLLASLQGGRYDFDIEAQLHDGYY